MQWPAVESRNELLCLTAVLLCRAGRRLRGGAPYSVVVVGGKWDCRTRKRNLRSQRPINTPKPEAGFRRSEARAPKPGSGQRRPGCRAALYALQRQPNGGLLLLLRPGCCAALYRGKRMAPCCCALAAARRSTEGTARRRAAARCHARYCTRH